MATLKFEVDQTIIDEIYDGRSEKFDPNADAKSDEEKQDYVNDVIIEFLKLKASEAAGNKAAEAARQVAIDEINSKPISKEK